MTDTAGCTCDLGELGMVVWTATGCPVHDCRPRVPYALDKDDPQVVEKAQANMDAAAAHYAERERVLRGRIEARMVTDCSSSTEATWYRNGLTDALAAFDA